MTQRRSWSQVLRGVRRTQAREFGLFTASTIAYQAGRFIFSLVAARALTAEDFTAWALVVALLVYAPSLLLGVPNGMSRELPILMGRESEEAAQRTVAAAWGAAIGGVTVILLSAVTIASLVPALTSSSVVVATLASGTIVFGLQQFILRSRLRFDAASLQLALFGVLLLGAALCLEILGGVNFRTAAALYGGSLLAAVVVGIVISPPPLPPRFEYSEMSRLAAIGFPIMVAGLVFSVFVTIDRWMAITLLGPQRAAPYALASLIAAAMLVVPTVVSQQTYPRMAIARGRGSSIRELRSMARHQGLIAAALVAPVAVGIALFGWLVIPALLPAYADAAPAVIVLSAGFIVLGYLTGYGNYLNVIGGQWRYLGAQLSGLAFAVVLMFVFGRAFGLVGIALGMALSHVAYGIVVREVAQRTPPAQGPPSAPVPAQAR